MELDNGEYVSYDEFEKRGIDYVNEQGGQLIQFSKILIDDHKKLTNFYIKTLDKNGNFICESDISEVKNFFAEKALKETNRLKSAFKIYCMVLESDIEKIRGHMEQWERHINELENALAKNIIKNS